MRSLARIDSAILAQRGHLFPWTPVCLALGIGAYFAVSREPGWIEYLTVAALGTTAATAALRWPGGWSALGWAAMLAALGFSLAGARAHHVAAPVLGWRYYGPVEGRIVALDRSASDALRITLDQVRLRNTRPERTPERVRLSLHSDHVSTLVPGARVMTTAHLSPPQGPVEPGGFDFRRHAWFKSLGAVGYTRVPVLMSGSAQHSGIGIRILDLRLSVSERIRAVLGGDAGGFAAAVTTGDRSGVSQETLRALRVSNLAHLLAISGLHMGLLAGFVFGALRLGLAAIPQIALRWPVRKLAAVGALVAASAYLALSGGNVATERAFVMVAVALVAVLVDRRAFSLRAVAMAALIVLALRPEALMGPGFQMSFAATTALVAVFGALRNLDMTRIPSVLRPVLGVVISSAVAGAATAPVAAAHFNMLAHYGLPANLLSVPLMGLIVVPGAVLAACLAPLGLEGIGLWMMGVALNWILGVAHWVTSLDGAQGNVISPGAAVLPVLALGLLWVMLWQGRGRWVGLAPAMIAVWMWTGAERPGILVSDTGGLVGIMTEKGRALSKPRGNGFVAQIWLENDGDGADQAQAASRWPAPEGRVRRFEVGKTKVVHVIGKRAASSVTSCAPDQIVIASVAFAPDGGCDVYDVDRLRKTGSLAVNSGQIVYARDLAGDRMWNRRKPRQ